MSNRTQLFALSSRPTMVPVQDGEPLAFAKWSLPLFWAALFDASSIVGPYPGNQFVLAAPLAHAGPRCEARLGRPDLVASLGPAGCAAAAEWIAFLRSVRSPWIVADTHDLGLDGQSLYRVLQAVDRHAEDEVFCAEFGSIGAQNAATLAGMSADGTAPPRPLVASIAPAARASTPPAASRFDWDRALGGLLGERDPAAWARYFPDARRCEFRADVACVAPGVYLWYAPRAGAWTVLWASCTYAAMDVFGLTPPPGCPNETFPALAPDVVDLDAPPLSYERLMAAARRLGQPISPGTAPRPSGAPFTTLVDDASISYFLDARSPHAEACAILFRGSPNAWPAPS